MEVNFKNKNTVLDSDNNSLDSTIFYSILGQLKDHGYIEEGYKISMPKNKSRSHTYCFDLKQNETFTFDNKEIKNLNFIIPQNISEDDKKIIINNMDNFVTQKITVKKINKKKIIENVLTGLITAGMMAGMAYMLVDSFMKEQELQEYENRTYVEELNREREKNGVEPIAARIK